MTKLLNVEDGKIISTRTFRNIRRAIKENNDSLATDIINSLEKFIQQNGTTFDPSEESQVIITDRGLQDIIKKYHDGSFVNLLNELDMIISKYTQTI